MNLCKNAGICGGCYYQGTEYSEELQKKEQGVRDLLDPVIRTPYLFEEIIPSPKELYYRNKMEFTFGDSEKDGPLTLGLHQKHSFFNIINAEDCQITDPDVGAIVKTTREYFAGREITYYHKKLHAGYLRHLLVRRAVKTGEILVDLVTTTTWDLAMRTPVSEEAYEARQKELLAWFEQRYSKKVRERKTVPTPDRYTMTRPDEEEDQVLEGWKNALLQLKEEGIVSGTFSGILHTKNDDLADVIKDQGTDILYGQSYFYEEILGLRFRITPFSFFQTNSLGAERLYDKVRSYAGFEDLQKEGRKPVIYDLYSGTGTITQLMSSVASLAVGVEIVEEAVEAARENAKLNGIENCDFIAGDVLKVITEGGKLQKEDGSIEDAPRPDLIILDPPRDGIHPKALQKIIQYNVDRLVYVACKPKSLARDLVPLQEAGYVVQKVACCDMFPRTNNCEAVCLLSKLHEAKHHINQRKGRYGRA